MKLRNPDWYWQTIIALAALILLSCPRPALGQPATQPSRGPAFVIGVWAQPAAHFHKVKALGVNTVVGYDSGGGFKKLEWEQTADAMGLWFVSVPGADLAAEAKQPGRLAWQQDDEPDLNRWRDSEPADSANNAIRIPGPRYKGWTLPSLLEARYALCKAADPTVPVFVNFAGPTVTTLAYDGAGHTRYLAASDWVGFDWHIKNMNANRYPLSLVGMAADRLNTWSGNKRLFVHIEVTQHRYTADSRSPTPDEVEAMVDKAIAHGATGVIYFTHTFKGNWTPGQFPNGWYGLTPEMEARVKSINAKLHARFNQAPTPPPTPLELKVAAVEARQDKQREEIDALNARLERLRKALDP